VEPLLIYKPLKSAEPQYKINCEIHSIKHTRQRQDYVCHKPMT